MTLPLPKDFLVEISRGCGDILPDADSLQSFLGLFDLDLESSMRKQKRIRMVEEDFHFAVQQGRLI